MRLAGIIFMSMICGASVFAALVTRATSIDSWRNHAIGAFVSAAIVGFLAMYANVT